MRPAAVLPEGLPQLPGPLRGAQAQSEHPGAGLGAGRALASGGREEIERGIISVVVKLISCILV